MKGIQGRDMGKRDYFLLYVEGRKRELRQPIRIDEVLDHLTLTALCEPLHVRIFSYTNPIELRVPVHSRPRVSVARRPGAVIKA
jgi:hypothetical protein